MGIEEANVSDVMKSMDMSGSKTLDYKQLSENINIQVLPGYEHVVNITPNRSGTYAIVCNEFCGIGHHKMVSKLYVK